jgi:hypothetical protein
LSLPDVSINPIRFTSEPLRARPIHIHDVGYGVVAEINLIASKFFLTVTTGTNMAGLDSRRSGCPPTIVW